MFEIKLASAV